MQLPCCCKSGSLFFLSSQAFGLESGRGDFFCLKGRRAQVFNNDMQEQQALVGLCDNGGLLALCQSELWYKEV